MSASAESCPALVLNADFRPLSYFPLSLWSWQDTLKAVFLDRVNVVSEYDRIVHSPSQEFRLPSVIARLSPGSTYSCATPSIASIAANIFRPTI